MIKKILLGAFIIYNVFVMSAYSVAADTSRAYKAEMNSVIADQMEVTASIDDIQQDVTVITKEDVSADMSEVKEFQKSDDQQPKNEKESIDAVTTVDSMNATGCDSTDTTGATVLSPNGGGMYTVGENLVIAWNTCNIPSNAPVQIGIRDSRYDPNIAEGEVTIGETTNAAQSYSWTIPPSLGALSGGTIGGSTYSIVVYVNGGGPNGFDESDHLFTINPSTTTPSITVVSPNGGEAFQAGQQIEVNWTTDNMSLNDQVDILIAHFTPAGGGPGGSNYAENLTLGGTANDGTEIVTLPIQFSGRPFGNHFKILVAKYPYFSASTIYDVSDNLFAINPSATTPTITVVSPNGGETYQPGQQITVLWDSSNIPTTNDQVAVLLQAFSGSSQVSSAGLAVFTINDGEEVVTLPSISSQFYQTAGVSFGLNFKISVGANVDNVSVLDYSDNLFSINGGITYPAGCTGPLGYSPLTGIPCTNPVTWMAGCTSANGYSMYNGQPCNWTIVYPNVPQGCVTNQGFSATTGQPCAVIIIPTFCNPYDSTTVPAVDVLSPNGGEHYLPAEIPVTWRTCLIPANTQMSIDLVMSRTGNPDLVRHLTTTINDGAQNVPLPNTTSWPQMVYGNNFKVRIYPTSGPSYGPLDQSNQNFSIALARVIVATDSATPPSRTVLVNNTASTNNVTLLKFTVTAEESDIDLRKIPVVITAGVNNISSLINTVKLYKDNDIIDSMSGEAGRDVVAGVITNNPCTNTCGFIFSNLWNTTVPVGTTVSFTIAVDIKPMGGNYPNGFSLTSSILNESVLLPTNFSVLDQNGDQLLLSQRSGFAQGHTQFFNTSIVTVTMGTPTIIPTVNAGGPNSGQVIQLKYIIPLAVSSIGATKYVGQSAQLAVTPTGTNAFAYVFNNAQNPTSPDVSSIASSTLASSNTTIEGNGYRIDDGTTKHFTLTITLVTPSTPNSNYRVSLQSIRIFTNGLLTTGATNVNLLPLSLYQTQFAFINN